MNYLNLNYYLTLILISFYVINGSKTLERGYTTIHAMKNSWYMYVYKKALSFVYLTQNICTKSQQIKWFTRQKHDKINFIYYKT